MQIEMNGEFYDVPEELMETFHDMTELQQNVCLFKLMGMSNIEAYYAAGGTATNDHSAGVSVSQILGRLSCSSFLRGCRELAFKRTIMSRDEMASMLSNLARTKISDVVDWHESDGALIDSETGEEVPVQSVWSLKRVEDMSGAGLAAISELTASKEGLKIKTHSQLQAAKQLSDLLGYNKPQQVETRVTMSLDDLYDDFEGDHDDDSTQA